MYVFRSDPEPTDFEILADHTGSSPESAMHSALWLKRGKIIERLRAVVARASVEEADRAIYHAMRLLLYR